MRDAEVAGPGRVHIGGRMFAVTRMAPIAAGEQVTLSVRPEHVRLLPGGNGDGSLEGTVAFVRDLSTNVEVSLDCDVQRVIGSVMPAEWRPLPGDGRVRVGLAADGCRVLRD